MNAAADLEWVAALIKEHTRIQTVPLVPEVRLHLADELVPLWQATEWRAACPQPPPFWAFAWPGSQALAHYLSDHPALVSGRSVMDFGSGSGLAAIAAVRLGATYVLAADIDPLAAFAQHLNAELNGVTFERTLSDQVGQPATVDLVLAGDVCYDKADSERTLPWLRNLALRGVDVLLADPGRHYAPSAGLELLATYHVPTLHELESQAVKRTRVWRVLGTSE